MSESKDDLIATLTTLVDLLARHGEQKWADWIGQDIEHLKRDDGYGIEHFLRAFGGMGSLNDVVLRLPALQGGGRDDAADDEFWRLKEAAWNMAQAFKREADREP